LLFGGFEEFARAAFGLLAHVEIRREPRDVLLGVRRPDFEVEFLIDVAIGTLELHLVDPRDRPDFLDASRETGLANARIQRRSGDALDRTPRQEVLGECAAVDHARGLADVPGNAECRGHPLDLAEGLFEIALLRVPGAEAFVPRAEAL